MSKINIEKFICSLYNQSAKDGWNQCAFRNALKKQGLKFNDNSYAESIVEISGNDGGISPNPRPLKIEKGRWYMCIKDVISNEDTLEYKRGKVYQSEETGYITDEEGYRHHGGDASDYFRPATEEEIPRQPKFNVGDCMLLIAKAFSKPSNQ